MGIKHDYVAVGTDAGDSRVSKDRWNDDHDIEDVIPDGDDTRDLGSAAAAFAEGHVNDVYAETIEAQGAGGTTQSDVTAPLVIASESASPHVAIYRASADLTPPTFNFYKARGSQGSPALVNDWDRAGDIYGYAHDGAAFKQVALIRFVCGNVTGVGDMPGRIQFWTAEDGSATLTHRWFIDDSGGGLLPATTSATDIGAAGATVKTVYTDAINLGDEALSDYDEGTWTPALTFATPGDLSTAFSAREAYYTRIGREVHCRGQLTTSTFTHTTASGQFRITGLPFTVANTTASVAAGPIAAQGWTNANTSSLTTVPVKNTTQVAVAMSRSGAATTWSTTAAWPTGGTVDLYFSFSYHI